MSYEYTPVIGDRVRLTSGGEVTNISSDGFGLSNGTYYLKRSTTPGVNLEVTRRAPASPKVGDTVTWVEVAGLPIGSIVRAWDTGPHAVTKDGVYNLETGVFTSADRLGRFVTTAVIKYLGGA